MFFLDHNRAVPTEDLEIWRRGLRKIEGILKEYIFVGLCLNLRGEGTFPLGPPVSAGPVENIKTRLLPRIYLKRKAALVKLSNVSIIGKYSYDYLLPSQAPLWF